jgi:nucleotide-binding universal stress UspA family protein
MRKQQAARPGIRRATISSMNGRELKPLRVLFAADESPGSERARALVRTLRLPMGSTIRVVRALGAEPTAASLPDAMRDEVVNAVVASLQSDVAAFAEPLRQAQVALESEALRGRAASVIVEEAERWRADLVVVGSHGRGAVASAILGSVAAEVVDHAPCPVLVARATTVTSIVLADDGSAHAGTAAGVVASGIFMAPVQVVSVVSVTRPLSSGIVPNVRAAAKDAYREALAADRVEHEELFRRRTDQLRGAGLEVTTDVRDGDPGDEILAAAQESGADLIAMGTRGGTGLQRLVLGSVARKVLNRASGSVLVARSRG